MHISLNASVNVYYTLEIIAFGIHAIPLAQASGADRIELCDNPGEGGTTPSPGMIRKSLSLTSLPVFPMIRPRGGDFLYSDIEFEIMKEDVMFCKDMGCKGVVLGMLTPDGKVDIERTARLTELASPMEVTFHRAFDWAKDPIASLEDIVSCGCRRILTSGCKPTAIEGADLIQKLIEHANDRVTIMPGSGIRSQNISDLAKQTGAIEFHSSASGQSISKMEYIQPFMKDALSYVLPNAGEIRSMKSALENLIPDQQ